MAMRRVLRALLAVAIAGVGAGLFAGSALPAAADGLHSVFFGYTGSAQTYTVPDGVTAVRIVASGASGGGSYRGLGGTTTSIVRLGSGDGDTLQVMVGGAGSAPMGSQAATAGFNGGGTAGAAFGLEGELIPAGGGGASDVRAGGCAATADCGLDDRVLVAGGGGGGPNGAPFSGGSGGHPATDGGDFRTHSLNAGYGGGGATTNAGGPGGDPAPPDTSASVGTANPGAGGTLGTGGSGGVCTDCAEPGEERPYELTTAGSGGGGGYYGGGGGGSGSVANDMGVMYDFGWGGAGGGGSSWVDPERAISPEYSTGDNDGNGQVIITPGPVISGTLPAGDRNQPYSAQLSASGGTGPYGDWSIDSGALPAGLSLDATTGELSGTPTEGGVFTFTVTISDADGIPAFHEYTLTVHAGPPAPTMGPATPTGPGEVSLSFAPPSPTPDSYRVYVAGAPTGPYTPVAAGTCAGTVPGSPCRVTGLTAGTSYYFAASSVTNGVEGNLANVPASVTAIAVPGVPGTPSASLTGSREVTVSWSPPTVGPGTPVTWYTVLASTNGGPYTALAAGGCAGPVTTGCVAGDLTAGATYRFQVAATNPAGTSEPSAPSAAVVVPVAPAAPVLTAATPGVASVTVTWTPPPVTSGITGYTATADPGGHTCHGTGASASSCLIDGLTNGTAYTATVVATGPFGLVSAPSNALAFSPSAAPGQPAAPTLTAGIASITASWTAPADPGSGISGYTVVAQPGPATCSTTGATSCVLGAVAGTAYRVTVIAHGTYGRDSLVSPVSNEVTGQAPAIPAAPPPAAPTMTTDQGPISAASPGQRIVLVGTGFAPYSTVTIVVYSAPNQLTAVVADANGDFTQAVTMPADLAGAHTFVALGVDPSGAPHELQLPVQVRAAPASPATGAATTGLPVTGLPVTGAAVPSLLGTGLALTLAGAALLKAARIRTRRAGTPNG